MKRYAAFLRGVSPANAKMAELRKAFEAAGFTEVSSLRSSGNLVFSAPVAQVAALERRAEVAVASRLGKVFPVLIRPIETLRAIVSSDPYAGLPEDAGAKRVVTFLRSKPRIPPALPIEHHGVRIARMAGGEVFSDYRPNPRGPVFMSLIEKTFGPDVTTRTWETVVKVVAAGKVRPDR